jgi:hypothetical protein
MINRVHKPLKGVAVCDPDVSCSCENALHRAMKSIPPARNVWFNTWWRLRRNFVPVDFRRKSASNMPTGQLNVGQKVGATFPYPASGRVRIQVEADGPVDVFVSTPEVSAQIGSVADAARFVPNVLIYNLQRSLNQLIDIPPAWRASGWTLTIGHPGHGVRPGVIAVHYEVYPV